MADVFDLLERIEQRPSMYIGWSAEERGQQLAHLESYLMGYATAVAEHSASERVPDFLSGFAKYLHEKYGWSVSCGAIRAIRDAAGSDDAAWDLLWKLVKEYRSSLP